VEATQKPSKERGKMNKKPHPNCSETPPSEFTLEDIHKIAHENRGLIDSSKHDIIAIRKESVDKFGTYLWRLFKEKGVNRFEEVPLEKVTEAMAEFLARNVSSKAIIKEVLQKIDSESFADLWERITKKPVVSVGVQKGSCVYLYVRGKRGMPSHYA
jgi:hypothetical protein